MKQEFYNLQINTTGQKLYEFTNDTIQWINQNKFEKMNIKFKLIDLIEDQLPDSDLIFCRDCLVHLSFEDIFKALRNIKKSNIKYFMTTNFNNRNSNKNIATGSWRTINFLEKPFNFPMPLENINENCTEGGNIFKDKSLLLWEIKNLPL